MPGSGTGATDPPATVYPLLVHALTLSNMNSSLDAVGFLAAVSAVPAEAGIPCNAVAAFHHDHLFVPWERAQRALDFLVAVAAAPAQIPARQQPLSN